VDDVYYKAVYKINFSTNIITEILVKYNHSDALLMTLKPNECIKSKGKKNNIK